MFYINTIERIKHIQNEHLMCLREQDALIKKLIKENNIHEKQIDKLQMKLEQQVSKLKNKRTIK